MNINIRMTREQRFNQLMELRKEFPNIIHGVCRKEHCDYAIATTIERSFVKIGYGNLPFRGFFINLDLDYENCFSGKYFATAQEAFDELSVWMHKRGYRFKKYDQKVIDIGKSPVICGQSAPSKRLL